MVLAEGVGSEVIIKRLLPEHADDPTVLRAFQNEAKVGVSLSHENVVDVSWASADKRQPEIVMQYVEGASLDSVMSTMRERDTTCEFNVAVAIAHAIACGLAHMHERGFVHRHLTPGNIMMTFDGCPKIIDFGATISGSKKPASRYTAPEFFSKDVTLDARGDVYAIGAILYELTTGRVLFGGEGNPREQILRGEYEPPTTGRFDYPESLSAILRRCMSPNPDARFQSADELINALEYFAKDQRYILSTRLVGKFMRQHLVGSVGVDDAPKQERRDMPLVDRRNAPAEARTPRRCDRSRPSRNKGTQIFFQRAIPMEPAAVPSIITELDLAPLGLQES